MYAERERPTALYLQPLCRPEPPAPTLPLHAPPGLPLLNKTVRQREQAVAAMRDAQYDPQPDGVTPGGGSMTTTPGSRAEAKNDARDDRLRARR